ncbi:hypothetical protein HK405_003644 [Cladochytrium tenue]|nr:hypothetical protein HK405_003644 [Cladochytrium tenue]
MTDAERDALDARVPIVVEGCLRRIGVLESAAKDSRARAAASAARPGLFALLGGGGGTTTAAGRHDDVLLDHRTSVTWLLTRRLMAASELFARMQERRVEVAARRSDSYLSLAPSSSSLRGRGDASGSGSVGGSSIRWRTPAASPAGSAGGGGSTPAVGLLSSLSDIKASVGRAAAGALQVAASTLAARADGWDADDDPALDALLAAPTGATTAAAAMDEADGTGGLRHRGRAAATEAPAPSWRGGGSGSSGRWMAGFSNGYDDDVDVGDGGAADEVAAPAGAPGTLRILETENEALLAELESGLDQVRLATQSLHEISTLHEQMAFHLQSQERTIERLHEDAVIATDAVDAANAHLRSASRAFGDARLWLLAFFLTASFVLLFLDYYYS